MQKIALGHVKVGRIRRGSAAGAMVLFSPVEEKVRRNREPIGAYMCTFFPRRIPVFDQEDEWDDMLSVALADGTFSELVERWDIEFAPERAVEELRTRLFPRAVEGNETRLPTSQGLVWGRVGTEEWLRHIVRSLLSSFPLSKLADPNGLGYFDETLEDLVEGKYVLIATLIEQLNLIGYTLAIVPARRGTLSIVESDDWSEYQERQAD